MRYKTYTKQDESRWAAENSEDGAQPARPDDLCARHDHRLAGARCAGSRHGGRSRHHARRSQNAQGAGLQHAVVLRVPHRDQDGSSTSNRARCHAVRREGCGSGTARTFTFTHAHWHAPPKPSALDAQLSCDPFVRVGDPEELCVSLSSQKNRVRHFIHITCTHALHVQYNCTRA